MLDIQRGDAEVADTSIEGCAPRENGSNTMSSNYDSPEAQLAGHLSEDDKVEWPNARHQEYTNLNIVKPNGLGDGGCQLVLNGHAKNPESYGEKRRQLETVSGSQCGDGTIPFEFAYGSLQEKHGHQDTKSDGSAAPTRVSYENGNSSPSPPTITLLPEEPQASSPKETLPEHPLNLRMPASTKAMEESAAIGKRKHADTAPDAIQLIRPLELKEGVLVKVNDEGIPLEEGGGAYIGFNEDTCSETTLSNNSSNGEAETDGVCNATDRGALSGGGFKGKKTKRMKSRSFTPSFTGTITNRADVDTIFDAARNNGCRVVTQRIDATDYSLVGKGFVFDASCNVQRWTEGLTWTRSRPNRFGFQLYNQAIDKICGDTIKRVKKEDGLIKLTATDRTEGSYLHCVWYIRESTYDTDKKQGVKATRTKLLAGSGVGKPFVRQATVGNDQQTSIPWNPQMASPRGGARSQIDDSCAGSAFVPYGAYRPLFSDASDWSNSEKGSTSSSGSYAALMRDNEIEEFNRAAGRAWKLYQRRKRMGMSSEPVIGGGYGDIPYQRRPSTSDVRVTTPGEFSPFNGAVGRRDLDVRPSVDSVYQYQQRDILQRDREESRYPPTMQGNPTSRTIDDFYGMSAPPMARRGYTRYPEFAHPGYDDYNHPRRDLENRLNSEPRLQQRLVSQRHMELQQMQQRNKLQQQYQQEFQLQEHVQNRQLQAKDNMNRQQQLQFRQQQQQQQQYQHERRTDRWNVRSNHTSDTTYNDDLEKMIGTASINM